MRASTAAARASLGDIPTFSFYPSKNHGCFGDGGAIATDDDEVAEVVRALRFHGLRDSRTFEYIGYNARLDEIQAAILRVMMPELDGWPDRRRAAAEAYAEARIDGCVTPPAVPDRAQPAWHLYVPTHPRAARADRRPRRPRGQAWGVLPAATRARPMAPWAPCAGLLAATDELARTNPALPMRVALEREDARCWPRSPRCSATDGASAPALEQVLVRHPSDDPRPHAHHDIPVADARVTGTQAATNVSSPITTSGNEHRGAADPACPQKRRSLKRLFPRVAAHRIVVGRQHARPGNTSSPQSIPR
jgi:hypothetical protein